MQVLLTHKKEPLLKVSLATRLDVVMQMMQTCADQLGVDREEIGFEFVPGEEDSRPFVSLLFIVGENMVVGSINTNEYALQREFGVVGKPYEDKNEVVKTIVSEMSRAAHGFSDILQRQQPVSGGQNGE